MITEEYFFQKAKEIASMKLIQISRDAAKFVYPRFKDFEPKDLDNAIDHCIADPNRFTFTSLLSNMNRNSIHRREDENNFAKQEFEGDTEFFWHKKYTGECNRQKCRGCQYLPNCKTRANEWIKGIRLIMKGNLGTKGADQLIHYMNKEFMGGI